MLSTRYSVRLSLMEEADPEAKDLFLVARRLHDREAEIECDRHRAEHGDYDSQAGADRDAIVLDLHVALHGAAINEADQIDLVVRLERDLILEAIEPQEVAADLKTIDLRTDASE